MDPEGKISEQKRKQSQSDVEILAERLLDGEVIPADKWTTSLKDILTLTHAVVKDFFKQTNDGRHVTEGYAFSKTKKFET